MKRYLKLDGSSGVDFYELGKDYIDVQFGEWIYRYTYKSAGSDQIEIMKVLAQQGKGLSTFISKFVKEAYASKKLAR